MVIPIPVPRDFGITFAKIFFGFLLIGLIALPIGLGIMFLVMEELLLGLILSGVGILLLIPLVIWVIRKIKEHREFVKEHPEYRAFSKENLKETLLNKRLVVFLTFTSVVAITIGILLITEYGLVKAGIPTIIGGVLLLAFPITALILKIVK
ncbi:MAG: hypothetical protein HGN29_02810 [Asgard group archaeon]|nr:hypothetical protein [Asgard group archaeon]